jgi:hypothetical protein
LRLCIHERYSARNWPLFGTNFGTMYLKPHSPLRILVRGLIHRNESQ